MCLLSLLSLDVQAKIYKCKDANGQMRFSDMACSSSGKVYMPSPTKTVPADTPKETAIHAAPPAPQPTPSAEPPTPQDEKKAPSTGFMGKVRSWFSPSPATPDKNSTPQPDKSESDSAFTCQGKTRCTQMTSCDEAKYYLKHCPGVEIDGDNDGIPCESQWCSR
jgi:hypothetical protein